MADVRPMPSVSRFTRPTISLAEDFPSTAGRTSQGSRSPFGSTQRPKQKFSPSFSPTTHVLPPSTSVTDLSKVLILLDTDKDGKIWEADLDTVVNLAFGAQISSAGNTSKKWDNIKEPFVGFDGMVKLGPLITELKTGNLFDQVSTLAGEAAAMEGCLGPFKGILQYVAMFDNFDTDRNGIICARDLKKALEKMKGKDVSMEESRCIIASAEPEKTVVDLAGFGTLASTLLGCSSNKPMTAVTEEDECCGA